MIKLLYEIKGVQQQRRIELARFLRVKSWSTLLPFRSHEPTLFMVYSINLLLKSLCCDSSLAVTQRMWNNLPSSYRYRKVRAAGGI